MKCQSSADVQYWTNIGHMLKLSLAQQPDHLGGWFWCQNDRLITYWGRNFKLSIPTVNCQLSTANYQLPTAILAKSQQQKHLGGQFLCQNYCLITYWGRNFKFSITTVNCQLSTVSCYLGSI